MAQPLLTPELQKLVVAKVDSGRYTSPSEVIEAALVLLDAHEQREARRQSLCAKIEVGLAQADAGEVSKVSFEDFKRLARDRFAG